MLSSAPVKRSATLLGGTVLSVADLHWGKASALAVGAFLTSVVLTCIQRRNVVANALRSITSKTVSFWIDLVIRLIKTFGASLAGLFVASGFDVHTFGHRWSRSVDVAEPAASNPSTMPPSYYVAAIKQEDVASV
jgi:hypothetical protein